MHLGDRQRLGGVGSLEQLDNRWPRRNSGVAIGPLHFLLIKGSIAACPKVPPTAERQTRAAAAVQSGIRLPRWRAHQRSRRARPQWSGPPKEPASPPPPMPARKVFRDRVLRRSRSLPAWCGSTCDCPPATQRIRSQSAAGRHRHGGAGVQHQAHNGLLNLRWIALDAARGRIGAKRDFDALAGDRFDHLMRRRKIALILSFSGLATWRVPKALSRPLICSAAAAACWISSRAFRAGE